MMPPTDPVRLCEAGVCAVIQAGETEIHDRRIGLPRGRNAAGVVRVRALLRCLVLEGTHVTLRRTSCP